ncbi:MAG: hypothetical protein ACRBDX_06800 [Gammaproteobacteria bacterium]
MDKELNKIIWLVLPVIVAAMPYIARFIGVHTDAYVYGETGIIENITVLFLFAAIIACLLFLLSKKRVQFTGVKIWMILFLLGAIYYAGEELSWGQHFFGWGTPEQWTEFNDQQETNLHNTAAIFDQIPRTLLSLAALIGGVLIPIYRKYKNHIPSKDSFLDWLLPTYVCLPAALFSLLVSWHEKIYEVLGVDIPAVLDIRAGETKECLLALFMMMYALSIWYRNRNVSSDLN